MSLKKIKLPRETVELPDGDSFEVRGLSLDDIAFLIHRHGKGMTDLFGQFTAQESELTPDSVAKFALPLIEAAPGIAAEAIACAAGDPSDVEIARSLPFPVQIDALEKTLKLTFEAGGGPKKLFETIVRLAQGTTGLLESLKA